MGQFVNVGHQPNKPHMCSTFIINRGALKVIWTHTWDLFLSTCLWVLVGGEILRDYIALMEKP